MQEGAVRNDFRLDIAKFLIFSHTDDDLIYLTTFLNMEKLCVFVCVCVYVCTKTQGTDMDIHLLLNCISTVGPLPSLLIN